MDFDELKILISSSDVKSVMRGLVEVRTKVLSTGEGTARLLEAGLVASLVSLLDRTNTRLLELVLSCLANLLLESEARLQLRAAGGVARLLAIVENLEEEGVVCRAWRALANCCLAPHSLLASLHCQGLATTLAKALATLEGQASRLVLVRCARVAGPTVQHRAALQQEGVLGRLAELALEQGGGEAVLAKALAKSMATLSLGAGAACGESLVAATPVLVAWAGGGEGKLADHALAALVNMSELAWLRPRLGNEGVVECLVAAFPRLEGRMVGCVVTALCLYCRESVNRVKLREGGGCRLLVEVLRSRQPALMVLHDRVLNSLLQFIYDNRSLNVLMDHGLVLGLVVLLEDHLARVEEGREGQVCLCGGEEQEVEVEEEQEVREEAPETQEALNTAADEPKIEEKEPTEELERPSKPNPVFRLTSPSYQAVQWELEQFQQLREAREKGQVTSGGRSPEWSPTSPSSLPVSPDRSPPSLSCHFSPSYSLTSSPSHSYSPSYSPCPSSYSPSSSPPYSPQEPNYSPVENFSDEELDVAPQPSDKTPITEDSPTKSDARPLGSISIGNQFKVNPTIASPASLSSYHSMASTFSTSPTLPDAKRTRTIQRSGSYLGQHFSLPAAPSSPERHPPPSSPSYRYSASSPRTAPVTPSPRARPPPPQGTRLTWLLQILSRLTQAERPHADLSSPRTVAALFSFLSRVPSGLTRTAKILSRLSTNLHCLLPWAHHRHLSYLLLATDLLASSCVSCTSCGRHLQEVISLVTQLGRNLTLLAETGYGEGEVCHRLVNPATPTLERQALSVSAPLLLRQRKLLRNVLVTHGSLECLLELVEQGGGEEQDPDPARDLFTQGVTSLSALALHLGVVAPRPRPPEQGPCSRDAGHHQDDLLLALDCGACLPADRTLLADRSTVFAAMLQGGFSEADLARVPLPLTSAPALTCLLHHLYGCPTPCPANAVLPLPALLELVSLADRFLLPDLSLSATSWLVSLCLSPRPQLPLVYRLALQRDCPVAAEGCSSLAQSAVALSLVGEMGAVARGELVRELVTSEMKGDYVDDVARLLRAKLLERS